jgi:RNA polymerase sigma factor (sigma-70 family)
VAVVEAGGAGDGVIPLVGVDFVAAFPGLHAAGYRIAFRLLGDRADAEECAQEACARAYARWAKVTRVGDATPWVVRVSANLALDRWRKAQRAARADIAPRRVPDRALADGVIDRVDLARALATLPRRQRQVVMLRYVADLPEAAVADFLGISAGAVKQHAARGLASMRAKLKD